MQTRMTTDSIQETSYEKKSDACYRAIRSMVVDFRLQPGAFIDKTELCRILNVSRQPVTTALSRLEREGLVEILPQRGSYVARLSLGTLIESLTIRAALEDYAARRLAETATGDAFEALDALIGAQEAAVAADRGNQFLEKDVALHHAIAATTRFPKLVEQVDIGHANGRRALRALPSAEWQPAKWLAEHKEIVGAIKARDGASAGRLAARHVEGLADQIRRLTEVRPELFVQ